MTGGRPPTRPPGAISPEVWAQLESVVDALLDTPPDRRDTLLAKVSAGDPVRRSELERLVAECERPHPLLDQPAARRFASLMDPQAERVATALADRYEVSHEIGRGGMATVYLARDTRHSRDVAVKVLRPDLSETLGGTRFLREIEFAARLRHPNIVPLYDSGWVPGTRDAEDATPDGVLFYVMPYESGQSVRERLARDGVLSIPEVLQILRDVCDALAYAHRAGVVHRDIKPDNVLLSGRHAMVTDFGVAKALTVAAGVDQSSGPANTDRSTTVGVSLGTPAYMAPEQIAADPNVDHRADIYAVGVLAYELLAGRPPFVSDEPQVVLAAHLSTAPEPIATLRPDVPAPLASVIMRCLAKRPADRWQNIEELIAALENDRPSAVGHVAGIGQFDERPPAAHARRRRFVAVATGVLVLAAVVVGALTMRAADEETVAVDPGKIVVVPFRVSGVDSSLQYLSEGVVDLLAAKLTGEGGRVAVDSRAAISAWNRARRRVFGQPDHVRRTARFVGAGEALSGAIVGSPGNHLTINVDLVTTVGRNPPTSVSVTGAADSLLFLLDTVVTRLVARQAGVTDQTLGALTSESMPAIRSYLWGRAEYRRGRDREAIAHFARAIEIDSTFALAGLDLVVAAGQPLAMVSRCRSSEGCLTAYFALGFRNPGTEADHRRLTRAADIAWRYRDKLSPRDLPLIEALRMENPAEPTTAADMIALLRRAATVAPDRVEAHYLLGTLLLYQGPAIREDRPRAQAAAAFRHALRLDPAYVPPIVGLLEVAAFERDTAELLRARDMYLARDSVSAGAAYVRWRVAATLGDSSTLASIRRRFDELEGATLQQIIHASLMSGLDLRDAERATELVISRASDPVERRIALASAFTLAMNQGRPRRAAEYLKHRATIQDDLLSFWTWAAMGALYWEGDSALAVSAVRDRRARIAIDTVTMPRVARLGGAVDVARHLAQQGLWDFERGDTAAAATAVRWLRRNKHALGADFIDALLATRERRADAAGLRARLDSVGLAGCCRTGLVHWTNLVVARAFEEAGDEAAALDAVSRGVWRFPPQLLSTYLREEGRLAARSGDRLRAIRAYRHYLALRSNPEPEVRPEVERIRKELERLERDQ